MTIPRKPELEQSPSANIADISAKIEEGYAAAQRGELIDGDQVRTEMEEKKRTWRADQRELR